MTGMTCLRYTLPLRRRWAGASWRRPNAIEAYTYRLSAHTTSMIPKYREDEEVAVWLRGIL